MSIVKIILAVSLGLLFGCATTTEQAAKPKPLPDSLAIGRPTGKMPVKLDPKSMDPDVLFMLMTAEIAGQRGQYDVAMEGYMEAAKRVNDPRLSERAALIAMYMKDPGRTNEAVNLWLKQEPGNLPARKVAALTALKSGDKARSVEQLDVLLRQDPAGFDKTVIELTGALQNEKSVPFVYEVLEDLALKHPEQASIYYVQSLLAGEMKNRANAEAKVVKALQLQPNWDKPIMLQAQLALMSQDYQRAESLLGKAVKKFPDNEKLKKMQAQVYIKSSKYEQAGQVFESLVANNPKDDESLFSLALVHLELGRDGKAEDILKDLLAKEQWRNQASFYLGKIEEKRENNDEAIGWYNKVSEGPFEFEAAVTAISLLAKNKQFTKAEERVASLAAKFPKQKPRMVLIQAELLSQQKQYQKAFDLLSDALKENPNQQELLYSRALMADRIDRLDVMEVDLKKILAKEPDNVEALNALGYSFADKTTRYQESDVLLLHALRLKPGEAVILDSYGWLKYKTGDKNTALEYLQKAYNKQPENEIAAHLAEVLWAMGRKDEARKLFDKAISDSPDDAYLIEFKKKFLSHESGG